MGELLTIKEVAELLRVKEATVQRWCAKGTIETIVLPHPNERRSYRIKREIVERLLENQQDEKGDHDETNPTAH